MVSVYQISHLIKRKKKRKKKKMFPQKIVQCCKMKTNSSCRSERRHRTTRGSSNNNNKYVKTIWRHFLYERKIYLLLTYLPCSIVVRSFFAHNHKTASSVYDRLGLTGTSWWCEHCTAPNTHIWHVPTFWTFSSAPKAVLHFMPNWASVIQNW